MAPAAKRAKRTKSPKAVQREKKVWLIWHSVALVVLLCKHISDKKAVSYSRFTIYVYNFVSFWHVICAARSGEKNLLRNIVENILSWAFL